jgi:hypothetical protein
MDVTAEHVVNIPAENLRVPREVFAAVWRRYEAIEEQPALLTSYVTGVIFTLRWLSGQLLPSPFGPGRFDWPLSPARYLAVRATPETIQEEFLAALRVVRTESGPAGEVARAAIDTIEWAWYGSGHPPVNFRAAG